ncbi:Protein of unknown function [Clostridium collagenovorans DSM 3089]|uniref:DUF4446 domain-containing protein n=1 Tax=Clostridium collagenovorans DSM 3089 TaxID=1121306 RepID=A0A1M5YG93_9CLOT|nr:DUF4446 family protein [Clostridium collagenovorans]SHI11055.1 Protein of unknown function [Clostridium collagenovorans DSM 3089]
MKEEIFRLISEHIELLSLALVGAVILLLLLNLILIIKTSKLKKQYKAMVKGNSKKSIESSITQYYEKIDNFEEKFEGFYNDFNQLNSRIEKSIQKVAVTRFKAFEDIGSDLSYSIALLDSNDDGVILTGIFGRNESTTYAKPIDKGISRYELSQEEKQVLEQARNSSKITLSR